MRRFSLILAVALAGCVHGSTAPESAVSAPTPAARVAVPVPREAGLIGRVVARTLDPKQGGSTTDVSTGAAVEIGQRFIAVSLAGGEAYPASTPAAELEDELAQFIAARGELRQPRHYLGTWLDRAEDLVYFDVTILVPYAGDISREDAIAEARKIGLANEQKSLFDLGTGTEVPVTSEPAPTPK